MVRAPVCGTGGRWFDPTQLYQPSSSAPPIDRLAGVGGAQKMDARLEEGRVNMFKKITGKQIAAGRVLSGIGRAKLAKLTGISEAELRLMEANDGPPGGSGADVQSVCIALEKLGVVFIFENGGGAGVRLKFNRSEVKQIARLEGEGGAVADDDI